MIERAVVGVLVAANGALRRLNGSLRDATRAEIPDTFELRPVYSRLTGPRTGTLYGYGVGECRLRPGDHLEAGGATWEVRELAVAPLLPGGRTGWKAAIDVVEVARQ